MTDITKEMMKLVTENLPSATAGAMKDFIDEAEKTKEELDAAEEQISNLGKQRENLGIEVKTLKAKLEVVRDLEEREVGVTKSLEELRVRERDIELEIARAELNSAQNTNMTIERLVDKVFGHPSVSVSTYKSKPRLDANGYETGQSSENENSITTQEKN